VEWQRSIAYQWNAAYSGDTNNSGSGENGNSAEQVAINNATPVAGIHLVRKCS
jgi:hypothetical protein